MDNNLSAKDENTVEALPFRTIPDLIHEHALEYAAAQALVQGERVLSYGEFDALLNRVAASLQRDGLKAGDVIAICAATSIEYALVYIGALRAGLVVAPLAPSSTAESLASMLQDAEAQLLFLDGSTASTLAQLPDQTPLPRVSLDNCLAGQAFSDWLSPSGSQPTPVTIKPEDAFNIIYSSGTTGTPKGIVQPHGMRWIHVQRGMKTGYDMNTVTLIATPLYSNTTLVSFFPTLALGGKLILMEKFDARKYLGLAQRYRVTHAMLVPVQYQRIMALTEFDRYDLSSFRYKFCTSAPFSATLKADVVQRWPGALYEYYGMTEGGGTCILAAHQYPQKLHTVGLPGPGHDIRLINDAGNEVGLGEAGEVVGHSEGMMVGYHHQPGKTADAEWFDPSGKRFIRTGDIGRFDEDGFLTLFDRKKDMIISGGFNIYPSDLEAVLRQHAEVADVAVVGIESERWGETPIAFVVPRLGVNISAATLLDWANARLGKMQRLADIQIVADLPRSAIGKILKRELRDQWRTGLDKRVV